MRAVDLDTARITRSAHQVLTPSSRLSSTGSRTTVIVISC